jgi:hypothetical protein
MTGKKRLKKQNIGKNKLQMTMYQKQSLILGAVSLVSVNQITIGLK